MSLTVPVPAVCPDCDSQHITVSTQPPSEHEYSGWTTKISCAECGFEAYQPELDWTESICVIQITKKIRHAVTVGTSFLVASRRQRSVIGVNRKNENKDKDNSRHANDTDTQPDRTSKLTRWIPAKYCIWRTWTSRTKPAEVKIKLQK